jgi:hypothetical protein
MKMETYNGYENYQTFAVVSHFDNNYDAYQFKMQWLQSNEPTAEGVKVAVGLHEHLIGQQADIDLTAVNWEQVAESWADDKQDCVK